tara:strand:- start:1048 stop:1230 length:183 start_codon:yes stop_codon:yes gene_type:complete
MLALIVVRSFLFFTKRDSEKQEIASNNFCFNDRFYFFDHIENIVLNLLLPPSLWEGLDGL